MAKKKSGSSSSNKKAKNGKAKSGGVADILTEFNTELGQLVAAGISLEKLYGLLNQAVNSDLVRPILEKVFDVISSGFISFKTTMVLEANNDSSSIESMKKQIRLIEVYQKCIRLVEELIRQSGSIHYLVEDMSVESREKFSAGLKEDVLLIFECSSDSVKSIVEMAILKASLSVRLPEALPRRPPISL